MTTMPIIDDDAINAATAQASNELRRVAQKRRQQWKQPKGHRIVREHSYNWEEIRSAYIQGMKRDGDEWWPTCDELADTYGGSVATIRYRCTQERWRDQRVMYQKQYRDRLMAERAERRAKHAIIRDQKDLNVANLATNLITVRLAEIAREMTDHQARRADLRDAGKPLEGFGEPSPVKAQEVLQLLQAAKGAQQMARTALGSDTVAADLDMVRREPDVDVRAELCRDDPDRLAKVIRGLAEAGVLPGVDPRAMFDSEIIDDDSDA